LINKTFILITNLIHILLLGISCHQIICHRCHYHALNFHSKFKPRIPQILSTADCFFSCQDCLHGLGVLHYLKATTTTEFTLCLRKKTFATPYVSDTLTLGIINSQPVRHFAPHLSSATVLPWEITEHKK